MQWKFWKKKTFVNETSIFGNQMHINVNDNYKSKEQIRKILTDENSIEVKRIDKIIPTLEDVFIHLLEEDKEKK